MAMGGSVFGTPPFKGPELNYRPHAGQDEISDVLHNNFWGQDNATIIEIIASRGWGKTLYFVCSILVPYLESHPNAKIMWVAPTYQICMSPIDDVFKGVDEQTGKRYVPEFDEYGNRVWQFATTRSGPVLTWYTGATVTFRSADAPDSIVSKGFNLIIMDEAALVEEQVFTMQILGTARKAGIKIFIITSPRGKKNWTYKIFKKGQDKADTSYLSFQQPYTKNPHFSPVLAKLIKDIPDWIYRQEYLAEFIEDGDSVFRGIEQATAGPEISFPSSQQEWIPPITDRFEKNAQGQTTKVAASDRRFVVGVDLAKAADYTVVIGMDLDTGEIVRYRRFNKTDYRAVVERVVKDCHELNHCELIFDATGVGAGIEDMLRNYDVTAHPYKFTNESKNELVTKLALAIEYREIQIPNIPTMIKELSIFTYTMTRTGKISYSAPAGEHDDIVMAIALANWFRKENVAAGDMGVIDQVIHMNSGRRRSFYDQMLEDND